MRIIVLTLSLLLGAQGAFAQDVKKVAEIYDTQVFANELVNGEQIQTLVPARLVIYPGDLHEGTTSITLEMDILTTASYVRVPKISLPVEYEQLFGDDSDRWLNIRPIGAPHMGKATFDLLAMSGEASGSERFHVTVHDGTGKPAAGVKIDITPASFQKDDPQITLNSTVLGPDGKLRVSLPAPPKDPFADRNPPGLRLGPGYQMVATDSRGQKQIMPFPPMQPEFRPLAEGGKIGLALVPQNADAIAYRGTVVDETGAPVSGASIIFNTIDLPGRGMLQFHGEIGTVYTAPDGTFSITVPSHYLEVKTGTDVLPPTTVLNVTVDGVIGARLAAGKDNRITIPHTEALTFQLLDSNGQPLEGVDNKRSPNTELTRTVTSHSVTLRFNAEIVNQEQAIIRLPQVPLPGEYRLEFKDYEFEPRTLAKGAGGATIVWQLSGHRATVSGRVVEAETGAPIAGAYVMSASNSDSLRNLSALTNEQRESLWTMWPTPEKSDLFVNDTTIKFDDSKYLHDVRALAKSDANGQFELVHEPDTKPGGVVVYVPGRVGATCNLHILDKPDIDRGNTTLPDVALPLKAEVQFSVNPPDVIPDPFLAENVTAPPYNNNRNLLANVSFERTGAPWKADLPLLNPKKDAPWELGIRSDWFQFGSVVTLPAPAGVILDITASGQHGSTLASVTWNEIGPLQPGQKIELPAKTIPAKRAFLVTVKKADGTPAVGVAVRVDGALPLTTDKDGAVIGWSSGHVGRIEVLPGNSWDVAAHKTDIEVPETGEMVNVELVIP